MSINLETYVNQTITATFRDGTKYTGEVTRNASDRYPYHFAHDTYTNQGSIWFNCTESEKDIMSVANTPRFTSESLTSLRQRETELATQLEELRLQIAHKEKHALPEGFNRDRVLNYLANPVAHGVDLNYAFVWQETPQGKEHWASLQRGTRPITTEDINQLQTWVIESFLIEQ